MRKGGKVILVSILNEKSKMRGKKGKGQMKRSDLNLRGQRSRMESHWRSLSQLKSNGGHETAQGHDSLSLRSAKPATAITALHASQGSRLEKLQGKKERKTRSVFFFFSEVAERLRRRRG